MIRYDLRCLAGHAFDGWFRSSADFDLQAARGMLGCPVCGSSEVGKALMAPAVRLKDAAPAGGSAASSDAHGEPPRPVALIDEGQAKLRGMLRDLREHMTRNSEDVGERFPEIARKMHAEEIEHRTVHGKASADEARALVEEGVSIQPLPVFPDEMN
jgi:hypothetical protein